MRHLILGGARSGKSRYAEQCAGSLGVPVSYVATAQALDDEMQQRIERHRQDRPVDWYTVESPFALAQTLAELDSRQGVILVDCLTLWLSNHLCFDEGDWTTARKAFLSAVEQIRSPLVLVSNEVGQGIVPIEPLSRRFVDEAGWLHQALAQRCDQVTLVVAGLPMSLKRTD